MTLKKYHLKIWFSNEMYHKPWFLDVLYNSEEETERISSICKNVFEEIWDYKCKNPNESEQMLKWKYRELIKDYGYIAVDLYDDFVPDMIRKAFG